MSGKKTSVTRQSLMHLIQELEDGTIGSKDREILMGLLRQHSTARREYLRYMQMVAVLQEAAKSRAEFGGIPISQFTVQAQKRRSAMSTFAYAMAALLVVGLFFLVFRPSMGNRAQLVDDQPGRGQVATALAQIEAADGASYSVANNAAGQQQDKLLAQGDRLHVSRGLVRLIFTSGVEVLAEGPSDLELVSAGELTMQGGAAWYRVPEAGKGFTVQTDMARIVDLGTEFGVKFAAGQGMQVHVGVGRVTAGPRAGDGPSYDLTAGEAVAFDVSGDSRRIPAAPETFQRHFSQGLDFIHWPFDQAAHGVLQAKGPLALDGRYDVRLRRLDSQSPVQDPEAHLAAGPFGAALSLRGDGVIAEAAYPLMGADTPRTFAAWIRHRAGAVLEQQLDVRGLTPENSPLRRSYSTLTPWGQQAYLLYYTNASISTVPGTVPAVLEAGVSYDLTFQASIPHGELEGTYIVDLVALPDSLEVGQLTGLRHRFDSRQVLASTSRMIYETNLGHQGELSFRANSGDPRLGQKLGIRLHKADGAIFYDEVKLTARRGGEPPVTVFHEGFERPVVSGMVPDTLPQPGWIGSRDSYGALSRGLYNEQPPYMTPYCGWSGPEARLFWAVFMDNSPKPRWCTGSGSSWYASAQPDDLRRNQWVHVASVFTGRMGADGRPEVHHYINGKRQYHAEHSQVVEGVLDRLAGMPPVMRFGALPTAGPESQTLDGEIDEVFLIRGVLNPQQIECLMQNNRFEQAAD